MVGSRNSRPLGLGAKPGSPRKALLAKLVSLVVIAGLIGAIGILANSQILIVGAMVAGPEYGAILSLAFGVTRRDASRVARSAAALAIGSTLAALAAAAGVSVAFGSWTEAWGSAVQLVLNVSVLTAVAILGLPAQRALWRRATRRSATALPIRAQWLDRRIQPPRRDIIPNG